MNAHRVKQLRRIVRQSPTIVKLGPQAQVCPLDQWSTKLVTHLPQPTSIADSRVHGPMRVSFIMPATTSPFRRAMKELKREYARRQDRTKLYQIPARTLARIARKNAVRA